MRIRQRLRQGWRDLRAFSQVPDYGLAQNYLTPTQLALFRRMTRGEQLHSLNVLRDVLAQEAHTPHDLAVACLLHDVGKSRYPLSITQRSIAVVAKRLLPGWEARWRDTDRLTRWRAPFVVRHYHPMWGATMAQAVEVGACALWLIAHHADPIAQWATHEYAPLLARLQRADDAN